MTQKKEWLDLIKLNYELIDLLSDLKKKYVLGLCSNAPSPFLRPILREHNLEDTFNAIIISSEIYAVKPEPKIFLETLEKLSLSAKETLFIDDNPNNVRGAEAVGIRGITFTSTEDLKKFFHKEGMLP